MKKTCLWLTVFLGCSVSAAGAKVFSLSLNKFVPRNSVNLRCIAGSFTLSIPIPERWEVKKAELSFPYINSSNLIADQAQLVVKVNDFPVGQTKLNPLSPEGRLSVTIPPSLLESGYNKLGFHVAQHFTKDCENPCAPDLWTTINFEDSLFRIEYTVKPVPLRMSDIANFVFDPKIFPQGEINIVTEEASSDMINLAGIVASGIARRFNYRKVVFSTSREIKPGYDNILIGRREFVESFLRKKRIEPRKVAGPYLRIAHLPAERAEDDSFPTLAETFLKQKEIEISDEIRQFLEIQLPSSEREMYDRSHALLVVSGLNLEHMLIAAETLSNMSFPYPGTDEMTVVEFSLPDIALYSGKQVLAPDKIYRFKTLGFDTHTFEGLQAMPMDITFRLPADFLIKQNQYVKVSLNFSYGGGMRPDSVLNILLNGKHVRAVALNKPAGDTLTGYKIELPTYLFKPGNNAIAFSPILTPLAKECDLIQLESLFLTIFENSTLYFPPMAHFVELPKVELFMLNGFPFTRWPDGYESLIYLASSDDNTIDAALNLIGLITQKNGYPLFGIKTTLDKPKQWEGELIVIGDVKSVPDIFKKNAPLRLTTESTVSYPVMSNWEGEESFAVTKQISGIGSGNGAIMEFQSPYKKGRTVLLLTANSTKDILGLSHALLEPGVQALSEGDLIMIRLLAPDYKVHALSIGKKYFTGKSGMISMIGVYLYAYPFLYYLALIVLILLLSYTSFILLKRYRKGRIPGAAGEEAKGRFSLGSLFKSVLNKEEAKKKLVSIPGYILKKIKRGKAGDGKNGTPKSS